MHFSLPAGLRFTLFSIYNEDSKNRNHFDSRRYSTKVINESIHFQKKKAPKLHIKKTWLKYYLNQKSFSYILQRIYKWRICTEQIFHTLKTQCMFFDTKGNCVFNLIFLNPWKFCYTKNNRKTQHKSKFQKAKWRL